MKKKLIILLVCVISLLLINIPVIATATQKVDYTEMCEEICDEYGICPEVIEALIMVESSGRMTAKNGNCYGICQINGDVWGYDYDTPEKQIAFACELLLSYDCEIDEALARYNGQSHPKYEGYVEKVLTMSAELERKHGK